MCLGKQSLWTTSFSFLPSHFQLVLHNGGVIDGGQKRKNDVGDNDVLLILISLAFLDTGELLKVGWVCLQWPLLVSCGSLLEPQLFSLG